MHDSNHTHRILLTLTLACSLALAAGCDADVASTLEDQPHKALDSAKGDQWGSADDPSLFSAGLEYRVSKLPMDGAAADTPWTGSYWPVAEDSINVKWDGASSLSPAAKYGEAFGISNMEDKVSKYHGIDAWKSRPSCKENTDCYASASSNGLVCAKREGETQGRCLPTWWGICHAWAPVAIMEKEPVHPVIRNGVEFKINDIKALLTLAYNHTTSKFLSLRCDEDGSSDEIELDEFGNPTGADSACKDTNPGTFHVVVTNYLGLKGEAFVEDRTYDAEVWNQPVSAYRITKQVEVSAQEANELLGVNATDGSGGQNLTLEGSVAKHAWKHFDAISVEGGQTVVVSMTHGQDPDLYVQFGAQATEDEYVCRPWLGAGGEEKCELTVPGTGATEMHVSVYGYTEANDFTVSVVVQGAGGGIPTDYVFNDEATTFYHVQMELDYIAESPTTLDGNLADKISTYTHTDNYNYILEVGNDGKIQGGEWMGASRTHHPDFLWLPTGRQSRAIAGGALSFHLVKSILEESIAGPSSTGGSAVETVVVTESGSVKKNAWKHYGPFSVETGALFTNMTGTGDADVYVRKGAKPSKSSYDCRPYINGSNESCTVAGPGEIYVSVHGYLASDFELQVTYKKGGSAGGATTPDAPSFTHLNLSDSVAEGEMKTWSLDLSAGQTIVLRTTAPNDIDLYARFGNAPTTIAYDQRAYTTSGNETVTMVAQSAGTLWIGVHGYDASDFELKTSDQ